MTANCFVEFSGSDFQASCDQTKLIFERGQNSEISEYHLRSLLKQERTDLSGDIQFGHVGDESLSNAGVPKTVHLIISGQNDPRSGFRNLLNPHTPVAQKVADDVVSRRFQGEGVEFFLNQTSVTPPDL